MYAGHYDQEIRWPSDGPLLVTDLMYSVNRPLFHVSESAKVYPENEDGTFFQNTGTYLPEYGSHPVILQPSFCNMPFLYPLPKFQAREQFLVRCPLLFIQYIHSCLPQLGPFSSFTR
jgi:hypothetical protein